MELREKYFLVVIGAFEKGSIEYDKRPTEKEIIKAIKQLQGKSARIEKRFVLKKKLA